jgi:DNA-binding response OmpR family regulator
MTQKQAGTQPLKGKKILLAEDEFEIRQAITDILTEEGVTVIAVKNGALAFQELLNANFDLVVSDIRMPGGDGIALLKEMQNLPSPPPLLFITAFADISPEEAIAKGACAILHKPFGLKSLLAAIEGVFTSVLGAAGDSPDYLAQGKV